MDPTDALFAAPHPAAEIPAGQLLQYRQRAAVAATAQNRPAIKFSASWGFRALEGVFPLLADLCENHVSVW